MPILDEAHDFAHPVEPDTAWSESYYFNAYDPGSDSGFFTRIGIRPNEGTMDVGLSVWLPGTELATVHSIRPEQGMPTEPGYINGGMAQREGALTTPVVTVDVEDIDAAVQKIEALGGASMGAKLEVGEMGWAAYFKDTEGNVVGLWQTKVPG